MKTKTMIICALFAAVICVLSPLAIPVGIIPVSLGLFAVMITAVIAGPWKSVVATVVFILLGIAGLPVFSNFTSGIGVLLGVTGGYIWSYIFVVLIIGFFATKSYKNKWIAYIVIFAACVLGIVVCYTLGTAQFMLVRDSDLSTALTACVLPFIPFDIAKAVLATIAGYETRQALLKAQLI